VLAIYTAHRAVTDQVKYNSAKSLFRSLLGLFQSSQMKHKYTSPNWG